MRNNKLKYVKPKLDVIFVQVEDGIANGSVTRYIDPEANGKIDVILWEEKESETTAELWF